MLNFNDIFFQEHQKQMINTLPSFAKALFCFYGVMAFVHPFFVPPPNQWVMSLISGVSAIIFIVFSVYVTKRDKQLSEKNIFVVISLMVLVAMVNTFAHLILTTDLYQTTNILFICVVLSAVGFSNRFFFKTLLFVNCSWLGVVWFFNMTEDPVFIHFLFAMMIGSFVSGAMAITKHKILKFSVMEIMRRKNAEHKLQMANKQLVKSASIDPLTGLANRRAYDVFLTQTWQGMSHAKSPISLIIADIDHFKKFNDKYGHQVGDEVLVLVGKTLAQCLRSSTDLMARYGGEEFLAVIPNMAEKETQQLAERMRKKVAELSLKTKQITISLGTATIIPDETTESGFLFKKADQALYDAKAQGRNRVCHSK